MYVSLVLAINRDSVSLCEVRNTDLVFLCLQVPKEVRKESLMTEPSSER